MNHLNQNHHRSALELVRPLQIRMYLLVVLWCMQRSETSLGSLHVRYGSPKPGEMVDSNGISDSLHVYINTRVGFFQTGR